MGTVSVGASRTSALHPLAMDSTSSVTLTRIDDSGDYVRCYYRLLGQTIRSINIMCEKEIGCCEQGCCQTSQTEVMPTNTNGMMYEELQSDNGNVVWCVLLVILAIAILLVFLTVGIVACKRYRYANANGTKKTVTPSAFPDVKIQP